MKILIADDDATHIRIATSILTEALNCKVDYAKSPAEAVIRLQHTHYDVAIVDMLFKDISNKFLDRLWRREVTLADRVLHESGLSVLYAIRSLELETQPVLWSTGDADRYLHTLFADEELGCKVFFSKGNISSLANVVEIAAAGKSHRDAILQLSQRPKDSKPLRETILMKAEERAIWRAMALGYTHHKEIEKITKVPDVRRKVKDAFDRFEQLNTMNGVKGKPSPVISQYATHNVEFFLDDTVRKLFP